MMNRFSSLSLRGAGLSTLTALAAISLLLGGCVVGRQIGGEGGNSGTTTGGNTTGENTTSGVNTASSGNPTSGGNTTSGGNGGAGGGGVDLEVINIAMLNSEITQITDVHKQQWLDTGEALDPTTLIVVVGTHAQSCNAPVFEADTGKNEREVLIGLPQAMQKEGTYDLSSTDVIAFGSVWLTDGMGNGGGGMTPLTAGTVQVLSIDSMGVNIRLAGLSGDFLIANDDYWVVRCP